MFEYDNVSGKTDREMGSQVQRGERSLKIKIMIIKQKSK